MTNRKRNLILGITAGILAAAIVIGAFVNIPLEKETYYYTFSTIAESVIALVAFLGAIVIFRMQLYENKRNYIAEKIAKIAFAGDPLIPEFIASTLVADEILEVAREKIAEVDGILTRARLRKMLDEIEAIDSSNEIIKTRMIDFSLMAICTAIISIIGLFLTPFLFGWVLQSNTTLGHTSVPIGNVYLFFITIFSCLALIFGLRVILEIFRSINRK